MASTTDVAFTSQETKVVFSGVGSVLLEVSGGTFFIGGAGVDETTGVYLAASGNPHRFYVTSPDDLYVHNDAGGSGTVRVYHNR